MTLRNLNQTKARGRILGTPKSGVRGGVVPSTGVNGPGYLYGSLTLPADADKEVCGYITTWPTGLTTFNPGEDSGIDATAPDGTYTFQFQVSVEGVAAGTPRTGTLTFGAAGATINCTTGNATAAGLTATVTQTAATTTISCAAGNATASGLTAAVLRGATIRCAVGNASADGLTASIQVTLASGQPLHVTTLSIMKATPVYATGMIRSTPIRTTGRFL